MAAAGGGSAGAAEGSVDAIGAEAFDLCRLIAMLDGCRGAAVGCAGGRNVLRPVAATCAAAMVCSMIVHDPQRRRGGRVPAGLLRPVKWPTQQGSAPMPSPPPFAVLLVGSNWSQHRWAAAGVTSCAPSGGSRAWAALWWRCRRQPAPFERIKCPGVDQARWPGRGSWQQVPALPPVLPPANLQLAGAAASLVTSHRKNVISDLHAWRIQLPVD